MIASDSRPIYPFDWLLIGYCLIMIAFILAFGRPLTPYGNELAAYASIAGIAALIVKYVDQERGRGWKILRFLYPMLFFAPLYSLTGGTIFLIFDRFFDPQLIAFEQAIFGTEPTLFIDRHLLQPMLNELFSFCYFAYYFMLPAIALPMLFAEEYDLFGRAVSTMTLTFALSFLLFFLYPIEGPRWVFADQYLHPVVGYIFRPAVEWVIRAGAVHGGAMPSSHTAISLIVSLYLLKRFRWLGRAAATITAGLAIGTFWGRFHYVSDVIVGVAIALFSYWLIEKYYHLWTHNPRTVVTQTRILKHVS